MKSRYLPTLRSRVYGVCDSVFPPCLPSCLPSMSRPFWTSREGPGGSSAGPPGGRGPPAPPSQAPARAPTATILSDTRAGTLRCAPELDMDSKRSPKQSPRGGPEHSLGAGNPQEPTRFENFLGATWTPLGCDNKKLLPTSSPQEQPQINTQFPPKINKKSINKL